jgi:prepilin-type N-terminal cleavage/methylation domain-containing protein
MQKLHGAEGFTLVELMMVTLIIAILVAIAVPIYLSATNNAKINTCEANLRTLDGCIARYQAEQAGLYPASLDAISGMLKGNKLPHEPADGSYLLIGTAAGSWASCTAGHSY